MKASLVMSMDCRSDVGRTTVDVDQESSGGVKRLGSSG